jgi:hypothetical protein
MTPPAAVNNTPIITLLLMLMIGGWIAILFIESSQPPAAFMAKVPGLDKIAHFLAFGILGLLICAVSFRLNPRPTIPLFSLPLAVVALSGIIEESYQLFIPGRTASLPDLLADVCGAIFSIVLANRMARLSRAYPRIP